MNAKRFLLPSAAALAFALAGSARASETRSAMVEGTLANGVRTVELAVTQEGFEPSRVKVNKGEKVRFLVTRKTDRTCATEIVIAEHGVTAALPLGKTVAVEFTPKRSGEIKYACGMGHLTGIVFVK